MITATAPWTVHLFSDFLSVGTVVYVFVRRSEIIRTTQHINRVYRMIIGISLLMFLLNTFRLIFEISGGLEGTPSVLFDVIADYGNLFGETIIVFYLLSHKIVVERHPVAGRILVIGAHPDDIEIAAGASIAKMHDTGYQIYGLVLSHGERGGKAALRLGEAQDGADFLELDGIQVLDFPDTQMISQSPRIVSVIEEAIAEFTPDLIFTHSRHDLHQDHQVVFECTLRAARNARTTILSYESPSVTQEFVPVYFLDVDDYVDVKIAAIEKHWDQHKKSYMDPELIRSKLAVRGSQARVKYAEGFEVVRMVSQI